MDRKVVVGLVFLGVVTMVAMVTSPTTAGCSVVFAAVVVVVEEWSCSCGVV